MLRGTLLGAALLVFVDVVKELPATLILRPFDFETLSVRVYQLASDERLAEASTGALAIIDHGSRNGVRFARLGAGDARIPVQSAELCLGCHVYIGDTVVVPVDEHARVPSVARRLTELIRKAGGVYGPGSILQRMAGLRRSLMAWIVGGQRAVR